ncbi:DDE-type integrase/transposase/recombinase, partial [Klebsiella pneumoniae]|uniref:DDE-type integrase/transposase/recombinase n=1 Tax=Klebsiella pneumoniae TaxID=573 RepID=UPI003A81303D
PPDDHIHHVMMWHRRLGHLNFDAMKILFPNLFCHVVVKDLFCDVCQLAKHVRASYPSTSHHVCTPFALIHSDVWGPSGIPSRPGFQYFITFTDDYTRNIFVYLLKDRSEVPSTIETFITLVEKQYGAKVQTFRSDNAKEYTCEVVELFFQQHGIVHETSGSYTPPQNGVAERKNSQLLNITRALLFQRQLPQRYWGDAVLTSAYLTNRMPSPALQGRTPFSFIHRNHAMFPLPPKVFGCVCYIHNHSPNLTKLDHRAIKGIFLGYSSTQKGYKCQDPL